MVKWGQQTFDEMHLGYVEFVVAPNSAPGGLIGRGPNGEFKFPKDGVPIPEQFREAFQKFDTNGNGILEEKEFDALPPAVKRAVSSYIQRGGP
jgi:hypothetical protein